MTSRLTVVTETLTVNKLLKVTFGTRIATTAVIVIAKGFFSDVVIAKTLVKRWGFGLNLAPGGRTGAGRCFSRPWVTAVTTLRVKKLREPHVAGTMKAVDAVRVGSCRFPASCPLFAPWLPGRVVQSGDAVSAGDGERCWPGCAPRRPPCPARPGGRPQGRPAGVQPNRPRPRPMASSGHDD
jgi:hypothetical protein